MSGQSLIQLVKRMNARPDVALIQTVPALLNAETLFARAQQFAMRAYGPIFCAGLSWWSGGSGNFWGHNAIIRTQAFAENAGLPRLPGKGVLGGEILSHDFIEAALLRRAGWRVEIAPDIGGSYEEGPPTIVDMAARDRRWAQGNMQHLSVVGARGLHPLSRAHILAGIMGYLSAPLWLALIAVGAVLGGASSGEARSGDLPAFAMLGLTLVVVLSPKILAVILWAAGRLPGWGRSPVFLGGVLLETLLSSLMAPVVMVSQSMAVAGTLLGFDAGWKPQARRRSHLSLAEALQPFAPHMLAGALLAACVAATDPDGLGLLAPIFVNLLMASPLSMALSARTSPDGFVAHLLATPEVVRPPAIAQMAERLAGTAERKAPQPIHIGPAAAIASVVLSPESALAKG
jgi:membrane glycosyltransferase